MAKKNNKGLLDDISKIDKRVRLSQNVMQGKLAESMYTMDAAASMKETRRVPDRKGGCDFEERTVNLLTGNKGHWRPVEIKSGGAKLSKLQKKTKRKSTGYKVIRY